MEDYRPRTDLDSLDRQPAHVADPGLVLDPTNPDIVYAATAQPNRLFGTTGLGILKSTDGGTTWTQLPGLVSHGPGLEASTWSLAVSPSHGDVLLVGDKSATGMAVFRPTDDAST